MSPLEYSAMLKLYRSAAIDSRGGHHPSAGGNLPPGGGQGPQKGGHKLKDTTPDSGVVADNNNSNSNSNQSTTSSNQQKQAKHDSSQNSLLSSSSSTAAEAGEDTTDKPSFRWDGTPLVDKTKESKLVKKVKSLDQQESGIAVIGNNRSELGQFRTNPINSDQFRSNNQMMPQRQRSAEDSTPPIPPIRESSVKREEI